MGMLGASGPRMSWAPWQLSPNAGQQQAQAPSWESFGSDQQQKDPQGAGSGALGTPANPDATGWQAGQVNIAPMDVSKGIGEASAPPPATMDGVNIQPGMIGGSAGSIFIPAPASAATQVGNAVAGTGIPGSAAAGAGLSSALSSLLGLFL